MKFIKNSVIAATLAATAMVTSSPAMAQSYRNNDNTAAIAIGAGVIGLAIGAIVGSSNNRDRYDDRYHVRDGWYYNDGYYYNRSGNRYNRSDWERRYNNNRSYRHDDRYENRRGNYGNYYNRRGY